MIHDSTPERAANQVCVSLPLSSLQSTLLNIRADLGSGSTFSLHLHFRHQRLVSKAVVCACDPVFDEAFLFDLPRTRFQPDEPTDHDIAAGLL